MRKHFYLITEHENQDRVGGVIARGSRMSRLTKNNETPIRVLDKEKEDYKIVGKKVALGYYDFKPEDEYKNNELVGEVIQSKIRDVDREWAEKAGVEDTVYGGSE